MTDHSDIVDLLLKLAFLEGKITTHGLYEQTVARRKTGIKLSSAAKNALTQKLEGALVKSRSTSSAPLTIGLYLRGVREHRVLQPQEVFSRLGISSNLYRMLEHDRISPLKISPESWRKIQRFFQIPMDALQSMIRRTHQLVYFRTSFRTTLARYDARKNRKMKPIVLEKAAEELFARASLFLPRKEQEKLDAFLKALAEDKG